MKSNVFATSVLALLAALPLSARDLPPIDEFAAARPHDDAGSFVADRARGLARAGDAIPVEARLRVPTFVWAARDEARPARPVGTPQIGHEGAAARSHLERFRDLYALDINDVSGATVASVHNTRRGPVIVKLRQQIDGIEIFREEMNVILDRDFELVGISGYLTSASTGGARGGPLAFELDERAGVLAALRDLVPNDAAAKDLVGGGTRGGYAYFTLPGVTLEEPLRVKKVYFHVQDGLVPGYYAEVVARDSATGGLDAYAYVISALDGHILFRASLTNNAGTPYTYRVWAAADGHPWDSPAGNGAIPKANPAPDGYQAPLLPQADITVANYPFSKNDPWLPAGAIETAGNNVDAYIDRYYPDGLSPISEPATPATGDFRAQATGTNAFLHSYDYADPLHHVSAQAAVAQLFVDVNFLHDWFYDAGFDEAAGNAQHDNYGRGGIGGDRLRAEAQDGSGFDNANMYTPADGASPRMQMYLFNGYVDSGRMEVLAPAAIAGKKTHSAATFGPQTFDVTQPVALPQPLHACSALTNAASVAGKVVLVDREPTSGEGSCSIPVKLANLAAAGAAGILVANLSSWPDTIFTLSDSMPSFETPTMSVTFNTALAIRNQLANGTPVTVRMLRPATGTLRDGTIDNQIVAHEWGHYLSNRLIGNGSGLTANQARGMGEGWSDFVAMLLEVRPDDTATPSNATWNGLYMNGTYAKSGGSNGGENQGYYFGVRRAPYSTDMTKNALTYKHTQDGVALPAASMLIRPNGFSNAQFHNTGEIWALMLWECYASLLRDTQGASPRLTFAEAQARMKEYLVAALKTTPANPTILEARDALLAAAFAGDREDYIHFVQAFAKRGAGVGAIAADRYSTTNGPVVESFDAGGDADLFSWIVTDAGGSCDGDGVLDNGETGQLTVTLKNTGATELNGVTATLTSLTPGLTFPSGNTVIFPDVDILETTSVTLPVALAAAGNTGIRMLDFSIEYAHAEMDVTPQTATLSARANFDEVASSSATDTVDGLTTPWTATSGTASPVAPWKRVVAGPRSLWHGIDSAVPSDERLESPPMTINAMGSLRIEFDHSFVFDPYFDGGVVEMSSNGGPWADIGDSAYVASIIAINNPLSGRRAFTHSSGGVYHVKLTPAVAAGDVVRVRFRIGTGSTIGASGWEIDNITFSGIAETPFPTLVPDSGCTKATATRLVPSRNPVKAGANLTLTAYVTAAGAPTGTVTFFDGAAQIGTAPLVNGAATLSTSALSAGTHTLTARYGGAAGYTQSTSAPLVQGVDGTCSGNPAIAFLTPSMSIPAGNTAQLSAAGSGGSQFTYAWYEGEPGNTSILIGTTATVSVTPATATTYWVRIIGGCGQVDSGAVEVKILQPAKLYTMTPCRAIDTRLYFGSLPPNTSRTFELTGWPNYCLPYQTRAGAINVTVIEPQQDGYLTVYPADVERPNTATTSFRAGKTRSTSSVISLSGSWGEVTVYNGSTAPVDFVIDVFAYFR